MENNTIKLKNYLLNNYNFNYFECDNKNYIYFNFKDLINQINNYKIVVNKNICYITRNKKTIYKNINTALKLLDCHSIKK